MQKREEKRVGIDLFDSRRQEDNRRALQVAFGSLMQRAYQKCAERCFRESKFAKMDLTEKEEDCLGTCYGVVYELADRQGGIFLDELIRRNVEGLKRGEIGE